MRVINCRLGTFEQAMAPARSIGHSVPWVVDRNNISRETSDEEKRRGKVTPLDL